MFVSCIVFHFLNNFMRFAMIFAVYENIMRLEFQRILSQFYKINVRPRHSLGQGFFRHLIYVKRFAIYENYSP